MTFETLQVLVCLELAVWLVWLGVSVAAVPLEMLAHQDLDCPEPLAVVVVAPGRGQVGIRLVPDVGVLLLGLPVVTRREGSAQWCTDV